MGLHELCHAVEYAAIARHVAGVHRGAETLLAMSAIYPAIGKPECIGGAVIVKHALRRVQDIAFRYPHAIEIFEHVLEATQRRFVGAGIFRRVDRVEGNLQFLVTVREAGVVDIGEDDQLEMALQVLECAGAVFEGRPVLDRAAIGDAIIPGDVDTPFLGETFIDYS